MKKNISTVGFKYLDENYQQELIHKARELYFTYKKQAMYDYKIEMNISKDLQMSVRCVQYVLDISSQRAQDVLFGESNRHY